LRRGTTSLERLAENGRAASIVCMAERSNHFAISSRSFTLIDAINPKNVWPPFGAFSIAVLQGEGQIVHLKGQVSLDQRGEVVGAHDMRAQVRKVLENVRDVLASIGGRMGDIVSLVHYATDIEQFMRAGDIRKEFFEAPYPVTTTVEVARLYRADLMIEITAIAEIPRDRFRRPAE
jgi:2-iminobutanoate/2-iminopropanoate deaminase